MHSTFLASTSYSWRLFITLKVQKCNGIYPYLLKGTLHSPIIFLATDETFQNLMYQSSIMYQHQSLFTNDSNISIITKFISQVLEAMRTVMKDDYSKGSTNWEIWTDLANQTYWRWQFLNNYVTADGKHIVLFHLFSSSSEFYRILNFLPYPWYFLWITIIKCNMLTLGVRCQGHISDGGMFRNNL